MPPVLFYLTWIIMRISPFEVVSILKKFTVSPTYLIIISSSLWELEQKYDNPEYKNQVWKRFCINSKAKVRRIWMRSLKNQQKLWYSTYADQITIYERDSDGNIIYDEIDGELIPRIKSERAGYNNQYHDIGVYRASCFF